MKNLIVISAFLAVGLTVAFAWITIWADMSQSTRFLSLLDTLLSWEIVGAGGLAALGPTLTRGTREYLRQRAKQHSAEFKW